MILYESVSVRVGECICKHLGKTELLAYLKLDVRFKYICFLLLLDNNSKEQALCFPNLYNANNTPSRILQGLPTKTACF